MTGHSSFADLVFFFSCPVFSAMLKGGPDSTAVKNQPYFNQWEDLDDSPVSWHITEAVDPCSTDDWLSKVGGGIY